MNFVRNLNEWELELVSRLIMIVELANFRNRWVWKLESSEVFSFRSLFKELTKIDGSLSFSHYSFASESSYPPKFKIFSWLLILGKLNTGEVLQKRKPYLVISPNWCMMCKMACESLVHHFLHCLLAILLSWVWPCHCKALL